MRTAIVAFALAIACPSTPAAQSLIGQVHAVTVARGDTLRSLGSRAGVDPAVLATDNGLSVDSPLRVGSTLSIDNRHIVPAFAPEVTIVVNVPQRMLFVATESGIIGYPVAVGRTSWETPIGAFTIVSKEQNPTWNVPESIREEARREGRLLPLRVPPGPANPLGEYWLGLSVGGIGIHGTNAPASVYRVITHGCVRLHAVDVADLFGRVQIGTQGKLVYEPVLVTVEQGNVFLEVHRDVYRRGLEDSMEVARNRIRELGLSDRVDWEAAAAVIRQQAGIARAITRR